jgi:hypothetical protein
MIWRTPYHSWVPFRWALSGPYGLPSVRIARGRLRWCIENDRTAAPCGRWVRQYWDWYTACFLIGLATSSLPAMRPGLRRLLKPRYRWEVRR